MSQKPAQTPGATASDAQQDDTENLGPWKGLQYRLVGPYRGGRVVSCIGCGGTGRCVLLRRSCWRRLEDHRRRAELEAGVRQDEGCSPSIGALAVSESDPNVIYVGTGEACIRGNIVAGNGVYKSIDAGTTWKLVGLSNTHAIGRVIVNPKNPDIAFVAALGHPFGENEERGIFRTRDGGKTWEKVLYKDAKTGGIDITFDPSNANILYASLWQAKRTPWGMDSGGPGSGLYKSIDGGSTWKEIKGHGLPETVIGRIGVTVSAAIPIASTPLRSRKRRNLSLRRRRRIVAAYDGRPPFSPARLVLLAHLR